MSRDAFVAGTEPGGLNSTDDIKILCCYLLWKLNRPISHDLFFSALTETGLVNYFELASAISDLLMSGNLIQDEEGYSLSNTGIQIASTLGSNLPRTVCEKALEETSTLLDFSRKNEQNTVQIQEASNGFEVTCSLHDDIVGSLFTLSVFVPSRKEAMTVRKNFIQKSEEIYRQLMTDLTGESFQ